MHIDDCLCSSCVAHQPTRDPLQKFGGRPCLEWKQGTCRLGEECSFRHDVKKPSNFCPCTICTRDRGKSLEIKDDVLREWPCPWGRHCSESGCLFRHNPEPPIRTTQIRTCVRGLRTSQPEPAAVQVWTAPPKVQDPPNTIKHAISSSTRVIFGPGASVEHVVLRPHPDGPSVRNLQLTVTGEMVEESPSNPNLVRISWRTPYATATLNFGSVQQAQTTLATFDQTVVGGRTIHVTLQYRLKFRPMSYKPTSVKISGLPSDVNKDLWYADLPDRSSLVSIKQRKFAMHRAYLRLRKDIDKAARVAPADYKRDDSGLTSGTACIEARYRTWDQARRVRDALADRRRSYIGRKRLSVSVVEPFCFSTSISTQQYKAQERDIESLVESCKDHPLARLEVASDNWSVHVKIIGNNRVAVGALKVRVEHLLAGKRLFAWDDVFCPSGETLFLETVMANTGAWIRQDPTALWAYGEASAVAAADEMLVAKARELASFTVDLEPSSLEFFSSQGIAVLGEIVGRENVSLDSTSSPPTISVDGGPDMRHILQGIAKGWLASGIDNSPCITRGTCSICLDDVPNVIHLECGHPYCHACIIHFLTSAIDGGTFPLCCVGGDGACKIPLSLDILRSFLTPGRLTQLLDASFRSYIFSNPEKYRNCPTPNCPQLYAVTTSGEDTEVFDCPSCFRSICSSCHGVPHPSFTCEAWKFSCNPTQQEKLLDRWAEKQKDNVKKCPRCNILIEKDAGCSHMRCRCGTHLCWQCMESFISSSRTYDHINRVHHLN